MSSLLRQYLSGRWDDDDRDDAVPMARGGCGATQMVSGSPGGTTADGAHPPRRSDRRHDDALVVALPDPDERVVYTALARLAAARGHNPFYATIATIAQEAATTAPRVTVLLTALEGAGFVSRRRRFRDDGSPRPNGWTVHSLPARPTDYVLDCAHSHIVFCGARNVDQALEALAHHRIDGMPALDP